MTWNIFEQWWRKSEEDKQNVIKTCLEKGIIIDEENSGLDFAEIEERAGRTGVAFTKVWHTFTDVAGMRDKSPGVIKNGLPLEVGVSLRKG